MPTRSNEQLCRLAQKGDTAARDILLEKNLGFIRKIALEQYRNMGLDENDIGIDLDDLMQEGSIGLLNAIPEVVTSGLNIAGGMIVVVGYAMVINMMRAGYLMPFFYLGFVTAAFTNFNLVALGVIGAVMAILYIQLSPKYNRVAGAPAAAAGNNDLDNELD